MKVEIEELESLLSPEDLEVNLRQILRYASRKTGSSKFSARKVRVSTWLPPECDGMSARG